MLIDLDSTLEKIENKKRMQKLYENVFLPHKGGFLRGVECGMTKSMVRQTELEGNNANIKDIREQEKGGFSVGINFDKNEKEYICFQYHFKKNKFNSVGLISKIESQEKTFFLYDRFISLFQSHLGKGTSQGKQIIFSGVFNNQAYYTAIRMNKNPIIESNKKEYFEIRFLIMQMV